MATQTLTINLDVPELVYDVQNKTYLTGRSRFAGNNHEEVANMQNNDDDEDQAQIIRSIASAFDYLFTKMSEYIDDTSGSLTVDNLTTAFDDAQSVTITLNHLPSNFNVAVKKSLASSIHNYIVSRAIGEWFQITDKADAGDYYQIAERSLTEVRETINKRTRPSRHVINNDVEENSGDSETESSSGGVPGSAAL